MASPPSCRTPPVMLSLPGVLLWSSFFIEASTSVGRMTGGALSIDGLIVFVCSLLHLYGSW